MRQATWQGIESSLPEPGASGLQAAMSSFWSSVQNVSTNPEDTGARQALAQSLQALGLSFQTASKALTAQRADVDTQAGAMIAQVNADATQISTLNTAIAKLNAVGQNPNDLLDQRDKLVDELSKLGNTTTTPGANGVVTVRFGGVVIVDPSTATGLPPTMPTRTTFNPGYPATPAVAAGLTGGQLKGPARRLFDDPRSGGGGLDPRQARSARDLAPRRGERAAAGRFRQERRRRRRALRGRHDHLGLPARGQPRDHREPLADRGLEHERGRTGRLLEHARAVRASAPRARRPARPSGPGSTTSTPAWSRAWASRRRPRVAT